MVFSIYPSDQKQVIRLKRSLIAAFLITFFCVISCVLYVMGYALVGWPTLAAMLSVVMVTTVSVFMYIRLGWNKKHKDPSLTLLQMFLAMGAIWIIAFTMEEHTRQLIMMNSLVIYFFGTFRLKTPQMVMYACVASFGYGIVLLLMAKYSPLITNYSNEFLAWLGYSVMCFSFIIIGSESSRLRNRLRSQNDKLRELLRQVQEIAITDELTGVFNRRHIIGLLTSYKAWAERGGFSFSVCYVDTDHFKRVNDTFGHNIGDKVLHRFAEILREDVRESDIVARMGGEEFLVVMPNALQESAEKLAERIRHKICQTSFEDIAPGLAMTTSVGVATYQQGDTVEKLISRADQGLYRAKNEGRNKVVVM